MIRVWSDQLSAGLMDRHGAKGSTFAYDQTAATTRAVSMTMPVRLASWDSAYGIHPIFEMNLPEGALRERLRLLFAKAIGTFDDYDLLSVVGQSQIGRLSYTAADAALDEVVPFQSVDEILRHRGGGDFFSYVMEKFAQFSGISGVQPKVLIRDEKDAEIDLHAKERKSIRFHGATHIVKFWNANEYPHLALNEFYCLRAAERSGLEVPRFRIAEDGAALVIDRFDLRSDGSYAGLEDFCVLNGIGSAEKYAGAYETRLFRRARDFISPELFLAEAEKLFTLFALNCALRNGDAHLKNFALTYDDVNGSAWLAPVYDIVTTTVYSPKDAMALTLDGSTRWPSAKKLAALGNIRCSLPPSKIKLIFERIKDALADTARDIEQGADQFPGFQDIADKMRDQWSAGAKNALEN